MSKPKAKRLKPRRERRAEARAAYRKSKPAKRNAWSFTEYWRAIWQ